MVNIRPALIALCALILVCGWSQAPNLAAQAYDRPHALKIQAPQIITLDCEEATIEVGELVRYAETFVDANVRDGATPRMYICPKDCQHGKIYPSAAGEKCPVCHYRLYEIRDGRIEHSNHRPRHGGVFFMGQDGFHHVEGVLISATEFRLYVYDNFTEPLKETCSASAEFIQNKNAPVKVDLSRYADGAFLSGEVPVGFPMPLSLAVRVRFGEQREGMLFNFTFDRLTR